MTLHKGDKNTNTDTEETVPFQLDLKRKGEKEGERGEENRRTEIVLDSSKHEAAFVYKRLTLVAAVAGWAAPETSDVPPKDAKG